jgi:hypothetical protein
MTQPNSQQFEVIFDALLAGEPVSEEDYQSLLAEPEWAERVSTFESMSKLGQQAEQEWQVPDWNRSAAFEQYLAKPSWWQRQGMSAAALCFSIFACAVMVFDLKVNFTSGELQIGHDQVAQQTWMQQEFNQMALRNQQEIDQLLTNFEQKQNQNNAKLVNYVLDSSRSERREEITEFVQMLQQQRNDDMLYLKQEFQDINYNLRLAQRQQISREDTLYPRLESELTE